ncbi:MAG: HAMP domain-containing histidine kinase [Acidobacteria bacterium]|nr:HAMP domain-containing histidine kinase [Acidobacteriota bacterium]
MRATRLSRYANRKLDELTAAEDFRGALWIVGIDINSTTSRAGEAVPLSGYPFFRVIFTGSEPSAGFMNLRRNILLYSTALFLLVTVLAGIFMYRAVSQEITVSRLKADFVSAVSHEFRTPLSSILALSERLDSERVLDKDMLRQYHATLRRDARRLSLLVEKLLDFAQLEEGKKQFSLDRINLADVAGEAVTTFQPSGASQPVQLVEADERPQIVGDRTAIVQCVQNLIENAIKYSPPGSPVTVRWGREDGRVFLEVRDRGIGIPASDRDKIFDKFYRAPNARAWHAQGTGIGLALVQRIIDIHGGSIDVESRPGEGSRFRLVFPESARI